MSNSMKTVRNSASATYVLLIQTARNVFMMIAGALGVLILAASAVGATNDAFYHYYFKEKRALTLDVDRIAILHARNSQSTAAQAALAKAGALQARTETWPSRGWSLASGLANTHPVTSRRELVRTMADDAQAECVTPVF